jgi:hypothetical protein
MKPETKSRPSAAASTASIAPIPPSGDTFRKHRQAQSGLAECDEARIEMAEIGKEVPSIHRVRARQVEHQVTRVRRHPLRGSDIFADDLIGF